MPAKAASTVTERDDLKPMSGTARLVTGVLVLALLAALVTLGTWQMQRLAWKEQLLAEIAERRAEAPVDLLAAIPAGTGEAVQEYLRVRASGTFDHAGERHFFATHQGRTGFYVYTPMRLADGRSLLVNRGFVPYEMKEPGTRAAGEVEGPVTITGYVRDRLPGKPSWLVPDNDPAKNIFYWKDWSAMVAAAGLDPARVLPFFVDADETVKNPGGWPQGGVTQFDLPNSHLQYAVTWYGLALALVAVVASLWWKRRRG
ncbi:SURF1 family protein [Rhizobium sp. SAFR-030]|uniref:SURF1 family protein n=1 Tax=Rhizobium sp. SAFR-030 TaxID=3387277 RepID=UPI003F7ED709